MGFGLWQGEIRGPKGAMGVLEERGDFTSENEADGKISKDAFKGEIPEGLQNQFF